MAELTFLLPDLGEGLTEADIVRWLVVEGDLVTVDQVVVEVETAKSVVEVPTPYAGRISALHAAAGTSLAVGKPLITVQATETATTHPQTPVGSMAAETHREEERAGSSGNVLIGYGTSDSAAGTRRRKPRGGIHSPTSPTSETAGRVPRVVSPLVRKLARQRGLDLREIEPTAPSGVIRKVDVESASAAAADALPPAPRARPSGERRTPLTSYRLAVSTALTRSRSEIPEATVWVDVDATALWQLRESTRTPADAGPGLMAYLARFVVAGLKRYPVLNARLDTEFQEIVELDHVNLGVAVQTERGLLVPAVLGADLLTTRQLDQEIRRVTTAAQAGRTSAEELSSGTFTLNNYGSFRVDGSAAIINHPQVAMLGIGRIIDRPWVVEGELTVRKVTQLSFVFDHRVCDGGTAAGFMRSVADAMENPGSAIARL